MLQSMLHYIRKSPDCFHAVETLKQMLLEASYVPLTEGGWTLEPGGKYFTVRNGSSLIAFRVPSETPTGFLMSASHSDSPCFRIRDHAELNGAYTRLSVERYGGMLNAPWLDRPLSVAGRVLVRQGSRIEQRLVDLEKDCVLIPNVAIHLNREANNGAKYDPARDLIPLYGGPDAKGSFRKEIAAKAGCAPEDILATDLFVYNNQSGVVWGPEGEFVSAPRLDDLACVFACAQGFLMAAERNQIPVLGVFDNEEIGSETKQGAASTFLPDTLQSIAEALNLSQADYRKLLTQSFLLSCDNGHGLHPNHPELADQNEAPVLNGGVVIKHSPRYATDGVSSAVFAEICRKANVPVQHYANRPDQAGGSTLGNIANTKTGVYTVDIGMAQLAMHSCFETAGSKDVDCFIRAVEAFYGSSLQMEHGAVNIL